VTTGKSLILDKNICIFKGAFSVTLIMGFHLLAVSETEWFSNLTWSMRRTIAGKKVGITNRSDVMKHDTQANIMDNLTTSNVELSSQI